MKHRWVRQLNKYSGYVDKQTRTKPYVIYSTGDVLDGFDAVKAKIRSYGQSIIKQESMVLSDASRILEMPSIWGGIFDVAIVPDGGLIIATDRLNQSSNIINGMDIFKASQYARVNSPNQHALYFHLREHSHDVSTATTILRCTKGTIVELSFSDKSCQSAWFFGNDGSVYFSFTANYNAHVGFFETRSTVFNPIGNLQPHRVYILTSALSIASGVVVDRANNPMPNCRIVAFRRDTLSLVGHTTSNQKGEYKMPIIALKGETIFMVCLDNDTAPDFEAIIYDRIQVA